MRYLILLAALLGAAQAQAWMSPAVGGGRATAGVGGGGCTDCSGARTLAAHMENSLDITSGTPCGCADGDSTWVLAGSGAWSGTQKSDGSYSFYHPSGTGNTATLSNNNDNFVVAQGSVCFDFYIDTYVSNARMLEIEDAAGDNRLLVYMGVADTPNIDIYTWWEGTNSGSEGYWTDCNISEGAWYTVCVTWDVDANPATELYTEVWALAGASQGSNSDTTITAMDASNFDIEIGSTGSNSGVFYVDNLQFKNAYDETDWR